ncbi:MAG: biotin carboxylase N-terminal domain-containing protein, partial [Ilumatobacteraceae bacterium]
MDEPDADRQVIAHRPIERLAVYDTGETAVRVLNAIGGLNQAGDAPRITTVVVHHDDDPRPWYGREADERRELPSGAGVDDVVTCLRQANVDTVWLGRLRGTPRVELVEACESAGIGVVGPDAETIRRLADHDHLRSVLAELGHRAADQPAVDPPAGEGRRRVEVDVLADDHGTVWILGGRDVSVRRAGRPLIAEAPCAAIGPELAARIRGAAVELVKRVGYRGAGTVVLTHDSGEFAVEGIDCVAAPDHATTEERTGTSVIGWRIRVQRGEALPADEPSGDGIVVEARLLAEDPDDGFAVRPGRVALLSFPVGTGVRVDANRRVGDPVDANDPLLAVVTAWGPDRAVALGR